MPDPMTPSSEVRLFILENPQEAHHFSVRIAAGGLRYNPPSITGGALTSGLFVPDQAMPPGHLEEATAFLLHYTCSQSPSGFEKSLEDITTQAIKYRTTERGTNPPSGQ